MSLTTTDLGMNLVTVGNARYLLHGGPDLINQELRQGRVWEAETLRITEDLLRDTLQPVVVDIGANIGAFSVPVGLSVQARGGRVFAYEAQRMTYYQLCANVFANQISRCQPKHLALGAANGHIEVPQLDLRVAANVGALTLSPDIQRLRPIVPKRWARSSESVPLRRLDDEGLLAAHLIKIDVEGMELEVLQGARQYLTLSHWPHLLFEVWSGTKHPELIERREALLKHVQHALGYRIDIRGDLCIAQHSSRPPILI